MLLFTCFAAFLVKNKDVLLDIKLPCSKQGNNIADFH